MPIPTTFSQLAEQIAFVENFKDDYLPYFGHTGCVCLIPFYAAALQRGFADLQFHVATLRSAFADLKFHFATLQRAFADLKLHFATLQ